MTLVEFLVPLKKCKHQDRILAILYYRECYEQVTVLTVDEIRQALKSARIKGWAKVNVTDVLTKSGAFVDTQTSQGTKRLWSLTDSGREYIRNLLSLPASDIEVEHDVGTLKGLVAVVADPDVRNYLEEAVKCLQVGALRACVVFLWTASIRTIQIEMITKGPTAVNAAIKKHDPKARDVGRVDDFAYIKDAIALLAAKELEVLDKTQKDTLIEALNLRNRCGHPGKYRPGPKKVSAFVEDIISIVFT